MAKNLRTTACLVIFFVITLNSAAFPAVGVYYDISFSSPEHTVGQPPVVDANITTPSQIRFGEPIVSESFGSLQDQPLVFNTLGNSGSFYYDQLWLDMDDGVGFYYVSFDMETENLLSSTNEFTIHFDSPSVQAIRFASNGFCNIFDKVYVPFSDNEALHFEVFMSVSEKLTTVYANGVQWYNGPYAPKAGLSKIRFNLGLPSSDLSPDHTTSVGIDNIFVSDESVLECGPIANAGRDTFVFADSNNVAEVLLDGTRSYDPYGGVLTYQWSWTVDGNDYSLDGASASIELPPGEHVVNLVVNNGQCDSEADQVQIMVYDANFKRYKVYICQGDMPDYPIDRLVSYFGSQPDIDLSYERAVMPENLMDYDVYMAYGLENKPYSDPEVELLTDFIESGGRVVFFTDHAGPGGPGSYIDGYLNNLLSWLGSSMQLEHVLIDGGGHHDSITDQIVEDPFTEGVELIRYAAVNSINGGSPVLLASNLESCFFAYELVGEGYLFVCADFNLLESARVGYQGYGNGRLFYNIVTAGRNHKPLASAGSNVIVYANTCGYADVELDGSGSSDSDGDELSYKWSWSVGGNVHEANGVSPTIVLPVGEHTIELVVNDGTEDSEPNYVMVTVVEPLEAYVRLFPKALNRHAEGPREVLALVYLGQQCEAVQFDVGEGLTLYPGVVGSVSCAVVERPSGEYKGVSIAASFAREEVLEAIAEDGDIEIEIVGHLNTGEWFSGSDVLRIR